MSEFQTRRFSYPAEFDGRLEKLATEHYNGNVSSLLRSAVVDHEQSLHGNDEFAARDIQSEIENLAESINEIKYSLDTIEAMQSPVDPPSRPDKDEGPDVISVENSVQDCLIDKGALSLDRITQQVDADILTIREAIEKLINREFVKKVSDNKETRYQISE